MEHHITVPAEWTSIEQLLAFADTVEQSMQLSSEQSYLLRLIIEEIATNIIKYSYVDDTSGNIHFSCSCSNDTLQVIIRDQGNPFDPNDVPQPDFSDDIKVRTVGGLGLFLIREFADQLSYTHDPVSGWNELIVSKKYV